MSKGKPKAGKVYALTGGSKTPSIMNGNTWSESEVKENTSGVKNDKLIVNKKIEIDVEYIINEEMSDIDFSRVENFNNFNFGDDIKIKKIKQVKYLAR